MTKRFRTSKIVNTTVSEKEKLKKQIEAIENGTVITSRSSVINQKNLESLKKKYDSIRLDTFSQNQRNQKFYSWGRKCQIYAWVEIRNFW